MRTWCRAGQYGKHLWVKANEVSSPSVLCCSDELQSLSFQELRGYSNCSNLSKNFSVREASGQDQIKKKKKRNQSLIRVAHFGTHTLLCFRPIQQDLCPQQNSLLIASVFIQIRKNLSLLYFCKWLHIFSTGKLTKSPFFFWVRSTHWDPLLSNQLDS